MPELCFKGHSTRNLFFDIPTVWRPAEQLSRTDGPATRICFLEHSTALAHLIDLFIEMDIDRVGENEALLVGCGSNMLEISPQPLSPQLVFPPPAAAASTRAV